MFCDYWKDWQNRSVFVVCGKCLQVFCCKQFAKLPVCVLVCILPSHNLWLLFGSAMLPYIIFLMKAVTGHVQKSYLYCAQNLKLHPPVQQANIKKYWVSQNVLWLNIKMLHLTFYREKPDIFSNQKDSSDKNYLSVRIYIGFLFLPGMS